MSETPKISIITPSKNTGKFAKKTIESVLAQTCRDWEHIVVDGVSTDETLDVLRRYSHLRWISEKDSCPDEAFRKGMAMAKGEYITLCCISDGYLDKNWLKKCVEVLDNRSEISLVWGIDQNMLENGTLYSIDCNSWFEDPPPNEKDYVYYWLQNGTLFHERNLCVRKNVIEECFQCGDVHGDGFWRFSYNFNKQGYVPYFIPALAAYGRRHCNAVSQRGAIMGENEKCGRKYYRDIKEYKKKIITGEIEHRYRDGGGELLPDKFDLKKYLESGKENKFKNIIKYLLPPLFIWLKNKLRARYVCNKNIKKIRKNLQNFAKTNR